MRKSNKETNLLSAQIFLLTTKASQKKRYTYVSFHGFNKKNHTHNIHQTETRHASTEVNLDNAQDILIIKI